MYQDGETLINCHGKYAKKEEVKKEEEKEVIEE